MVGFFVRLDPTPFDDADHFDCCLLPRCFVSHSLFACSNAIGLMMQIALMLLTCQAKCCIAQPAAQPATCQIALPLI